MGITTRISSALSLSSRIPVSLQKVFISSNSGIDVHRVLPPLDEVGSKVFYKENEKDGSLHDDRSVKNQNGKKKTQSKTSSLKLIVSTSIVSPQVCMVNLMHSRGFSGRTSTFKNCDHSEDESDGDSNDCISQILHELASKGKDEEIMKIMSDKSSAWLSRYARLRGVCGESLVHLLCRYCSDPEVLSVFLRKSESNISVVDNFGRTPLHYICWRDVPNFKMIDVLIKKRSTLKMFATTDIHGSCPLSYVPRDDWNYYNVFINLRKDIWFKPKKMKSGKRSRGINKASVSTIISGKIPDLDETDNSTENKEVDEKENVIKESPSVISDDESDDDDYDHDLYYDISDDEILKEMMVLIHAHRASVVACAIDE